VVLFQKVLLVAVVEVLMLAHQNLMVDLVVLVVE
tara:strand:- start:385 stop:486 length:102 start_codon:yes stop_codon:yes gene_type:complete